MKVTRNKEFTPITITLETEEEAIAMWAKLALSSNKAVEEASRDGVKTDYETCFRLFTNFDEVFDPRK